MDFAGFPLFIGLAGVTFVLLGLTIFVRFYRKTFATLLVAVFICLLILGGWLYKVYWLDEPLPEAARSGDFRRVEALLKRGASPDSDGIDGVQRAIVAAADSGNADIVALLIREGADPSLKDGDGRTAMEVASEKGFTNIVQLLLTAEHEK